MSMATQAEIGEKLGVKPVIDANAEIENRVQFLADYVRAANAHGLVLGISGGQDSALAGRISQMAVERLREEGYNAHFVALHLPYMRQADADDAVLSLDFIQPDERYRVNIEYGVKGVVEELVHGSAAYLNDYHKGNIKARIRAVTQYAFAGPRNSLVVGTDHAAEAVTGFFTKYGDGAADVLPLSGLTKRQGKELLKVLGAPEKLYTKAPTADLLDGNVGQPDEQELGLTYDQIDSYLEGQIVAEDVAQKIEARYFATEHKRFGPVGFTDETWWKALTNANA